MNPVDAATLLSLQSDPTRAAQLASAAREAGFGKVAWVRPTPAVPEGVHARAVVLRRSDWVRCAEWPHPEAWQRGDRVAICVEPEDARAFVTWLAELAGFAHELLEHPALGPASIAPYSGAPAGTHRLWAIAVARLSLPENIRVEARHDLVGIRLAQVALGFGADTLAGPIAPPRVLPLAGVSRPDENTVAALSLLVTEAGLTPELFDPDSDGVPFEILDGGTQPLETDAEES